MLMRAVKRLDWERRMLGRLLKYDFLYFFRFIPVFYLVILGLGAAGKLWRGLRGDTFAGDTLDMTLIFLSVAIGAAIMVITLVMVLQRFRDNLLKDPAYLMLTLPVSPWTLVASKALSAAVTLLLSGAVCAAAMSLYLITTGFIGDEPWYGWLRELYTMLGGTADRAAFAAASAFLGVLENVCLFYACLVAAQMLPRFRMLAVAALYFLVPALARNWIMNALTGGGFFLSRGVLGQPLQGIAVSLAFTALYFWVCGFLLKHTLNVE